MLKVVQPSSWDGIGESNFTFHVPGKQLEKTASTIFGVDYDKLKPDKDHIGIHLVGLGDYEHFGLNRNYDGFTKESCIKYGSTFVSHGHVYEHHINKDPEKSLGVIKMSAYNPAMGRQELFIHAHKDRASEHLHIYEKTGSVSFSMACNVKYDTCNKCGSVRKNRFDDTTCDHLRYQFGKEASDGTLIGTLNPEPLWFDISFVKKPADRIAWDLKQVASYDNGDEFRKWTHHLESGMTLPSYIAFDTPTAKEKLACLRSLVAVEEEVQNASSLRKVDREYLKLVKQAVIRDIPNSTIEGMREYPVNDMLCKLAEDNVILSPEEFFKYVFGTNPGNVDRTKIALAVNRCSTIFHECAQDPVEVCTNDRYDIRPTVKTANINVSTLGMGMTGTQLSSSILNSGIQKQASIVIDNSGKYDIVVRKEIDGLAKEYVAYKVASMSAISKDKNDTELRKLYTSSAVQNLYK